MDLLNLLSRTKKRTKAESAHGGGIQAMRTDHFSHDALVSPCVVLQTLIHV